MGTICVRARTLTARRTKGSKIGSVLRRDRDEWKLFYVGWIKISDYKLVFRYMKIVNIYVDWNLRQQERPLSLVVQVKDTKREFLFFNMFVRILRQKYSPTLDRFWSAWTICKYILIAIAKINQPLSLLCKRRFHDSCSQTFTPGQSWKCTICWETRILVTPSVYLTDITVSNILSTTYLNHCSPIYEVESSYLTLYLG